MIHPFRTALSAVAITVTLSLPAFADTPATAKPAAHPATHHRHTAKRTTLAANRAIRPLTQPAHPTATDSSAPVPNQGITPPIDNADQETSVAPAVMQIHYPPQGDGYTLGSSAQAMDDKQAAKVTGVLVHVPLGQ
jgi:hypothetical protein